MGKIYDTDIVCEESVFDQVTGLPTLPILEEHFQLMLADETLNKNSLIPVLILQLNKAKASVPDLDLEESTRLLNAVGRRLTSCTITGVSGVAVLDSTHYALVMINPEQDVTPGFISAQVQQIINTITHPYKLATNSQVTLAANLGVACYPCDGSSLGTLLENAWAAMQEANAAGENCYHFYTKY